jgi:2-methylisocitrate lyase-like PEP mutase family enzyme
MPSQSDLFHRLHSGPAPLILVNAWDAASARVIERAGASAIATTSAGIAWSLGYADGERMPADELIAVCARIRRVTRLPLSVDLERGYGDSTQAVRDVAAALIDLGVAGINIEDGTRSGTRELAPPEVLCERIAAIRALDARFFINARTDTHIVPWDDPAARFEETLRRATLCAAAGADGIFVPGLASPEEIEGLSRAVALPVNVYAGYAGAPPAESLARAGARRISLGCGPLQAALGLVGQLASEALAHGRFDAMDERMLSVGELNALFSPAA